MSPEAVSGVASLIVACIAIYQIYAQWKLARITRELDMRVHRLSVDLDQSIQRLHRARDLVSKICNAEYFIVSLGFFGFKTNHVTDEDIRNIGTSFGEMKAALAELRGIAYVLRDEELLKIIGSLGAIEDLDFQGAFYKSKPSTWGENKVFNWATTMYQRIYELLLLATADHTRR